MVEESVERRVWETKSLLPSAWRDELLLTSTGVGHLHRDPEQERSIKRTTLLPLPPSMRGELEQSAGQGHLTTYRMNHSFQPHGTVLTHATNDRAAPSYKTHHNENFTYRLADGQSLRRPLTLEKQVSEHQDQFRGLPSKPMVSSEFGQELRQLELAHHTQDGMLKKLHPSEPQKDLGTSAIHPHERGVLQRNDRYATTSGQVHRGFLRKEQMELPRTNQATFYTCEQYPKAWGYGTKETGISQHAVQQECGRGMVNRTKFKHRCHSIPASYQLPPVPNCGQTIQQSSFLAPSRDEMEATFSSPFPRQQHITAPVSFGLPVAPRMYQPLNATYGTAPL